MMTLLLIKKNNKNEKININKEINNKNYYS